MRSWISIGLWVLCILFPLAWLGTLSPAWKNFMDWLLAPEWLHVVMHLIIFAGLIILVMANRRHHGKEISFLALIAIILTVGIAQELLQYLTADYWVHPLRALRSSAFDLMVDLAGGMIGMGIYLNLTGRKTPALKPPMD